jgi:hypothetical protein
VGHCLNDPRDGRNRRRSVAASSCVLGVLAAVVPRLWEGKRTLVGVILDSGHGQGRAGSSRRRTYPTAPGAFSGAGRVVAVSIRRDLRLKKSAGARRGAPWRRAERFATASGGNGVERLDVEAGSEEDQIQSVSSGIRAHAKRQVCSRVPRAPLFLCDCALAQRC